MCNDHKFDYSSNPAKRLYINANRIRYIGKESNNLEENLSGVEKPDYLEYNNSKEFYDWILTLKPKDVKDKGISQQALYYQKSLIKSKKHLNVKQKVARKLLELYQKKIKRFQRNNIYLLIYLN
jgi:predicted RNA-binding protein with PUA domain